MAWVNAEQAAFLQGVQVGDLVIVHRRDGGWKWCLHSVERTSSGRVWVDGTEFNRKTGDEWGGARIWPASISPFTSAHIEEARLEVVKAKEAAYRRRLMEQITPAVAKASIAKLERIAALLAQDDNKGSP